MLVLCHSYEVAGMNHYLRGGMRGHHVGVAGGWSLTGDFICREIRRV